MRSASLSILGEYHLMARLMHAESWMLRIFNLDAEYILHGKKEKNRVLQKVVRGEQSLASNYVLR